MAVYLIFFILSSLIIYLYEHKKVRGKILLFFSLLLPCILAGMRNISVGTDTSWYPKLLFDAALSSDNFSSYYNSIIFQNAGLGLLYKVSSFEIGFSFLTYVITKVSHNFHILLFFIHVIIIFPFFLGLKKYKYLTEKKILWFSMLLFYFYLFNWSLNAMRQFMATSIFFWGLSSIINEEDGMWKKYFLSLIVAFLFHKTSLISIPILLIFLLLRDKNKYANFIIKINEKLKINTSSIINFIIFIISLLLLCIPFLLRNIALFFNVDQQYINYIGTNFSIVGSSAFSIPVILLYFLYNKKIRKITNCGFYKAIYILFLFSQQLSTSVSQFGARISFYFLNICIVGITLLANSPTKLNNRKICSIILISTAFLYWIYNFAFKNYGQTYPYIFYFYVR